MMNYIMPPAFDYAIDCAAPETVGVGSPIIDRDSRISTLSVSSTTFCWACHQTSERYIIDKTHLDGAQTLDMLEYSRLGTMLTARGMRGNIDDSVYPLCTQWPVTAPTNDAWASVVGHGCHCNECRDHSRTRMCLPVAESIVAHAWMLEQRPGLLACAFLAT